MILSPYGSLAIDWNKGASKTFGYLEKEIIRESIMRLISADRKDEENLILTKIKRGENVQHFETQRITKKGRMHNPLLIE